MHPSLEHLHEQALQTSLGTHIGLIWSQPSGRGGTTCWLKFRFCSIVSDLIFRFICNLIAAGD